MSNALWAVPTVLTVMFLIIAVLVLKEVDNNTSTHDIMRPIGSVLVWAGFLIATLLVWLVFVVAMLLTGPH